jgi:hypothetical protein
MVAILVMIMVVIIPIVIAAPAVCVFVPPTMIVLPAVGTRFRKFMTPVLGLGTLPAVVLDGLVKFVVGFGDASLAVIHWTRDRSACEQHGPDEQHGGQHRAYFSHCYAPFVFEVQFDSGARMGGCALID